MPAKKAAKKVAAKHAESKDPERKDVRRAYEHLGRVEALQKSVTGDRSKSVHTLVALAEKELGKGHGRDAADLLRAAEHLSFAALASIGPTQGRVSGELKGAVKTKVEQLIHKAKRHWEESDESQHHASVTALFGQSLEAAEQALDIGSYRQALELSRGAEALAHVKRHGSDQVDSGAGRRRLPKL